MSTPRWGGRAQQVGWWRSRPPSDRAFRVCACDCHVGCPLAGQPTTPRDAWRQRCVCPGAADAREVQQVPRGAAARDRCRPCRGATDSPAGCRTDRAQASRGVPGARGGAATGIDDRIPGGRRGQRRPRHADGATAARWGRGELPGASGGRGGRPSATATRTTRAQLRQMHRVIGSAAAIASLLTAAAGLSSGPRRLMWGAGAALSWLTAAAVLAIGTALTQVSRLAEERSRPTPF